MNRRTIQLQNAKRERDELRAKMERYRSALNCDNCFGQGWTGYADQPTDCPVCTPTRNEAKNV